MNTFKIDAARETRGNSGIMLPVIELVIAIGLFTIISIFIIRFFTSANTMSRQADELSKGLIKAESVIELSRTLSPEEVAKEIGGEFDKSKNSIQANYDKYAIYVHFTEQNEKNGMLRQISVTVLSNKGKNELAPVAELRGAKYIKGDR